MHLSEREKTILGALVGLYVRNAGPVSSGEIVEVVGLDLSSASVRNVLHGLEKRGLLQQPHTSAGRVPTRAGYREYVDHFCHPGRLPERWLRRIRDELRREPAARRVEEILDRVSGILAGLSSQLGLAVQLRPAPRIQRIDLVLHDSTHMLAVVTLDNGAIRTEIVDFGSRVGTESLEDAVRVLNPIVLNCTLATARARLEEALSARMGAGMDVANRVALEKDRVFGDGPDHTLHLQGATEIMGQPEFTDPENLRLLVRILDHPESLESALLEQERRGEAWVTIGFESHREELRPFSVVMARCLVGGKQGLVGILGPMRMRYPLAMSLVRSVAEETSLVSDGRESGGRSEYGTQA